jgi:hypothetical protein
MSARRSAAPNQDVCDADLERRARRAIARRDPRSCLRTRVCAAGPHAAGCCPGRNAGGRADGERLPATAAPIPQILETAPPLLGRPGIVTSFSRPTGSSHLFLLTQGYAIPDGPAMPIIGEGDEEPNDRYIEQLVASAQAAVDAAVEMGAPTATASEWAAAAMAPS